jgi:hypothetical protein
MRKSVLRGRSVAAISNRTDSAGKADVWAVCVPE